MENSLHDLTKHVFFEFLAKAGRVYLLVRHSPDVVLGSREFTAEERSRGIMLVFNSRMKFQWDIHGITATLVFGSTPQRCFIPLHAIAAVYSPDVGAQFALSLRHDEVPRGGIRETGGGDAGAPHQPGGGKMPDSGADPLFAMDSPGRGVTPRSPGRRKEPPEGKLIKVDFAKKRRKNE